jgi:hypothetical protein
LAVFRQGLADRPVAVQALVAIATSVGKLAPVGGATIACWRPCDRAGGFELSRRAKAALTSVGRGQPKSMEVW